MGQSTFLEGVLRRDRSVVLAGLVAVAALAWAYMVFLAMRDGGSGGGGLPTSMDGMALGRMAWTGVDFGLMYVMWAVMMVAMMVPTAAPMILTFATIYRRRRAAQGPYVPTGVFLGGYLVIWAGFALLATMTQWGLHQATLLSSMMGSVTPILGGSLLLAAGVFQWTPLKYACLSHCRTPMGFIMSEWREGTRGAVSMGVRHGVYCVGCCWFLMALMFVAGAMNLVWMAGIASYMLVEKVTPPGAWGSRVNWIAGAVLATWGIWAIAQATV